ncbi:MAG: tetratricopeptide repeat protein [Flavobacteriales bacterium]
MKKIYIILFLSLGFESIFAQDFSRIAQTFQQSYIAEAAGNYASAIKELESISPASYEINYRLGWLHYLNRNYSQAVKAYQAAVKNSPNSIEARTGLITTLTAMENYDEVLKVYQDILRIDPNHSKSNYWIAVAYYYRKDYTKATEHLTRVLKLYPFDYDANLLMAQTMLAKGKIVEAKQHYQKALLYNPTNKEIEAVLQKL